MLQLIKKQKASSYNASTQYARATNTNKALDITFAEDLKVILQATQCISNPTTRTQVLEFCLSALIAKYAENKIVHLLETDLQKALNPSLP